MAMRLALVGFQTGSQRGSMFAARSPAVRVLGGMSTRKFASVSMDAIKELRAKTGTGVSDCKAALTEAGGDIEAAYEVLRKKGLATATKKAGRVAAEGLVGISQSTDLKGACIIEVNSETDFVSRNEAFVELVQQIAAVGEATQAASAEELKLAPLGEGTVQDGITAMVAKMGENINLRRASWVQVSDGVVSSYIHTKMAPGLGRMGVLVALEADTSITDREALDDAGKRVAMHIAAASPRFLDRSLVDVSELEKEKELLAEQARAAGKKEEFVEKIVMGRLNKYYQEVCLADQTFLGGGDEADMSVSKFLTAQGKALGGKVAPVAFTRWDCGEGIQKEAGDYAAEVAELAGQ